MLKTSSRNKHQNFDSNGRRKLQAISSISSIRPLRNRSDKICQLWQLYKYTGFDTTEPLRGLCFLFI